MKKAVAITVSGRVQGVFFRKYTREKAVELGLNGFVKNLPDGNVYIEASGIEADLEKLIAWCSSGSPMSKVQTVKVKAISMVDAVDFEIR